MAGVQTLYVQSSTVNAGADITATSHLMNCQLRAEVIRLTAPDRMARSGSIVGGLVLASRRLEARQVNFVPGAGTEIGIGPNARIAAQMRKLDGGIEFCRTNILRIFRTLGIRDLDAVRLRQLIAAQPAARRDSMRKLLAQLQQLGETRERSTRRRVELQQEQILLLRAGEIAISQELRLACACATATMSPPLVPRCRNPSFLWTRTTASGLLLP